MTDDMRPPIPASLAHRPVRGGLAAPEAAEHANRALATLDSAPELIS